MAENPSEQTGRKVLTPARRDLALIAMLLAIVAVLEIAFNVLDRAISLVTQALGEIANEMLGLGIVLMLVSVAFAWRRWRELRKEVEQRTRAEQRYRALFVQANDAILIFDPDTEVIHEANERAGEVYGLTRDALIGRSLMEFSTNVAYGQGVVHSLLADNAVDEFTFVQRRADDQLIHIVARASVIEFDGRPAILTINRDVTAQRDAEATLRASEQRFRALVEKSWDAVAVIDLSGAISYASPSTRRVIGYAPEELIGQQIQDLIHPDDHAARSERGAALQRGGLGAMVISEIRSCHKDGGWRWLEVVSTNLIDDPAVRGVVVNYRDITGRKAADAALRESEERYRRLVEQSPDAIAVHSEDRYIFVNDAAVRLFGGSAPEDVLGHSIYDFVPDKRHDEFNERLGNALVREERPLRIETKLQRLDGTILDVETIGIAITYEGKPAAHAVYRDVTERKQAEQTLRQQNVYLSALHETTVGLLDRLELSDLLATILTRAGTLLGASDGFIFWFEDGNTDLPTRLGIGIFHNDPRPPVRKGEGLIGTVWETGESLVLDDYQQWAKRRTGDKRDIIHASLAVPLCADGQVIGVISLVHLDPERRFSADEIALLTRFADLAAIALQNARLYGQLSESEASYRTLIEMSPEPILVHRNERHIYANAAAVRLYHAASAADLIDWSMYDLIPPEFHVQARQLMLAGYTKREPMGPIDVAVLGVDGTALEVELHSIPIVYEDEPATLTVMHDITERKNAERLLRESEERYRLLFESNPMPMWVYDFETLAFLAVNDAAVVHYGYSRDEFLSMGTPDIRPPEEVPALRTFLAGHVGKYQPSGIWRHQIRNGALIDVEITSYEIDFEGRPARLVVANDVTERMRAEEGLRESEERYRQMFAQNTAMQLLVAPNTGAIVDANAAACAFYGFPHETLVTKTVADLRARPEEGIIEELARFRVGGTALALQHRLAGGEVRDVEVYAGPIVVQAQSLLYEIIHDITERKRAEEQLIHNALHDTLTGLPNRALFAERLARALDRSKRDPAYRYAVLYLDFDRFKTINDSLGHLEGDRALVEGARRLAQCVRPQDTLARLGGDEFVLLFEELADWEAPVEFAQCLNRSLLAPIALQGQDVTIVASIGVVLGAPHYHRPEELLRDADIAMYQAKALRAGEPVVFDAGMHARAVARLHLENELRRAVEREEFILYYQPIVALDTEEIVGFEALVRWQHPDIGLIAPLDFIPIAEETGLIVPLGRWVLREACRQMCVWIDTRIVCEGLTMSINVSARELQQPDFASWVLDELGSARLEPGRIALEITESALIEETHEVAETLRVLHDAGVRIHLDDFGIGYSSLSYLHRFPLDALKIDRSFVSAPGNSAVVNRGIVEAIVALARTLGIAVTAEGIETIEQETELRSLACLHGQGYLFSSPGDAEQITDVLHGIVTQPAVRTRAVLPALGGD